MNAIYEAIDEFEFSNAVFPMTQEYANWETDAVIFGAKIQTTKSINFWSLNFRTKIVVLTQCVACLSLKKVTFLKIGLFQVIKTELFRNIGLSMACVFVTMLLLLADIWGSVLTMICVVMSLIDVMGYMQAWGLTIDVVSSVIVIISIGLCVDYSAHIAHAFLTSKGLYTNIFDIFVHKVKSISKLNNIYLLEICIM